MMGLENPLVLIDAVDGCGVEVAPHHGGGAGGGREERATHLRRLVIGHCMHGHARTATNIKN